MPYISRMTNTTMPWIKANSTEEKELEGEYNAHKTIIILTPEGVLEIRRVSDEEAARLCPAGSENWVNED